LLLTSLMAVMSSFTRETRVSRRIRTLRLYSLFLRTTQAISGTVTQVAPMPMSTEGPSSDQRKAIDTTSWNRPVGR